MFFFEWKGETIDDRSENFQQLCNTIKSFRLIGKVKEDIVDRTTNIGTEVEEFAIDSMESGFKEVSFTRVFGIE